MSGRIPQNPPWPSACPLPSGNTLRGNTTEDRPLAPPGKHGRVRGHRTTADGAPTNWIITVGCRRTSSRHRRFRMGPEVSARRSLVWTRCGSVVEAVAVLSDNRLRPTVLDGWIDPRPECRRATSAHAAARAVGLGFDRDAWGFRFVTTNTPGSSPAGSGDALETPCARQGIARPLGSQRQCPVDTIAHSSKGVRGYGWCL